MLWLTILLLVFCAAYWRELAPVWRWLRGEGRLFGLYRHKKGGLYWVLGLVRHSERKLLVEGTENTFASEELILYVSRSGWWVRPAWMFLDGRFRRVL